MKFERKTNYLVLVLLLVLAIPNTIHSMKNTYLYIEEIIQSHQDGRTTKAVKKSYYYKDRVLIADSSQPYEVLINTAEKLVYLIDKRNRSYSVLSLVKFSELSKQQTAGIHDSHIMIHKTGKKTNLNGIQCDEFYILITSLSLKTSVYLAPHKKLPMNLFYSFSQTTGLGGHLKKVTNLMKKNNSYPMLSNSISSNPGGKQFFLRITTRSIEERQYDASLFTVPKHYKKLEIRE